MTKVDPRSLVCTLTSPRCSSITCLVMYRPRPVPRSPFVVKKGSKIFEMFAEAMPLPMSAPTEPIFDTEPATAVDAFAAAPATFANAASDATAARANEPASPMKETLTIRSAAISGRLVHVVVDFDERRYPRTVVVELEEFCW